MHADSLPSEPTGKPTLLCVAVFFSFPISPFYFCCCCIASVVSLCDPIDGSRLPRPWDSPGKNTGVGCHFLLQCRKVKSESEVDQSCPTFSDPMDCSPPGSSVHGVFQARVLEWGATAFSILFLNTPELFTSSIPLCSFLKHVRMSLLKRNSLFSLKMSLFLRYSQSIVFLCIRNRVEFFLLALKKCCYHFLLASVVSDSL